MMDSQATNKAMKKSHSSLTEDRSESYKEQNNIAKLMLQYEDELQELYDSIDGKEKDRVVLYRFLKAFKFDMPTVKKRLQDTMRWREEIGYADIYERVKTMKSSEFPHAKLIQRHLPEVNSYSRDRDGNLVGIICPGRIRPNEVAAHVTTEQVLEYNIYMMASVAFELAELSRQTGTVVRITRIIDLDGLSMRHASNNMIRFIRSNLAVAQSHFVEFMAHAIVINAPAAFTIIWKMIKPLLHERTVKKVVITGATYADVLDRFIAPEAIPKFLNGTCSKPTGFHDYETGFESVEIAAAGEHVHDVVIEKLGTEVEWQFRTKSKDILFEVQLLPQDDSGETEVIRECQRVQSHKHTIVGSHICQRVGVLRLRFDNSYSRWTSKQLSLRTDVIH